MAKRYEKKKSAPRRLLSIDEKLRFVGSDGDRFSNPELALDVRRLEDEYRRFAKRWGQPVADEIWDGILKSDRKGARDRERIPKKAARAEDLLRQLLLFPDQTVHGLARKLAKERAEQEGGDEVEYFDSAKKRIEDAIQAAREAARAGKPLSLTESRTLRHSDKYDIYYFG